MFNKKKILSSVPKHKNLMKKKIFVNRNLNQKVYKQKLQSQIQILIF